MILYFSGTGNSRMVAYLLADRLNDVCRDIPSLLRDGADIKLNSTEKLGLVFPVYSWGVPPIVLRVIEEMRLEVHPDYLYFVCSCGDETGLAPQQLVKALSQCGLKCSAGFSVIMPNNYVLLPGFDIDSVSLSDSKLASVAERIDYISGKIKSGSELFDCHIGPLPYIKSKLVYPLFVRWGIRPSLFHVTPDCVGCGKCASACPVSNVLMRDKRPLWGNDCTSCLGCYHVCPYHAVRYWRTTDTKGQYFNPFSFCKR